MSTKKLLSVLLASAAALSFSSCRSPKYFLYTSEAGDFSVDVPYAWRVFYEEQGSNYVNTTFVGPFDPDFFRGAPSFSIRWHSMGAPFAQGFGMERGYSSAEDYAERTLKELYADDALMEQNLHRIGVSGKQALHFVVSAPMFVPGDTRYGASRDEQGNTAVLRQHAYVVVPAESGFYVLIYPGTRMGFNRYEARFTKLVNSFRMLRDGPAGAKL